MLVTSNAILKQFPKFSYAKVHLQYEQATYKATNQSHAGVDFQFQVRAT